jgi:hypothetical protein
MTYYRYYPKKNKIIFAVTFFVAVLIIAFILWICFFVKPDPPPPRDVRMLIYGNSSIFHMLSEVNGSNFEMIRFTTLRPWNYGAPPPQGTVEMSIATNTLDTGDSEGLDNALLYDFAESRSGQKLLNPLGDYRPYDILRRRSVELSDEQLNAIWKKIDNLIKNYKEPKWRSESPFEHINIVVDGQLYWGTFYEADEYFRSYNYKFPREYRRSIEEHSDMSLLILAHYMIDLMK